MAPHIGISSCFHDSVSCLLRDGAAPSAAATACPRCPFRLRPPLWVAREPNSSPNPQVFLKVRAAAPRALPSGGEGPAPTRSPRSSTARRSRASWPSSDDHARRGRGWGRWRRPSRGRTRCWPRASSSGAKGVVVNSSVLGVVILAVSLVFFDL